MTTRKPHAARRDKARPATGRTRVQQGEAVARPRLPHERDESADSQSINTSAADGEVRQHAYEDAQQGRVDTDRGPVLDEVYERNFRPSRGGPGAARGRGSSGSGG